jgi:Na+/H+ antiporter NhaD/arsenite permease-like protein
VIEFALFAATLLGVAVFHSHTLRVALLGLGAITVYKLAFTGFRHGAGFQGLALHVQHEWVLLANLLALLVGFELLSRHFEESGAPAVVPRILPSGWKGAFVLLGIVFALSGFLDNIAAALIGATVARSIFGGRVHIGYLAAIVAAANAGGAGSVVGDTTTTMMWLAGVSPAAVLPAYLPAFVALLVFGIPAAMQQERHATIVEADTRHVTIDWTRIGVIAAVLTAAIATNVLVNMKLQDRAEAFPFIGVAVWLALLACAPLRRPEWKLVPEASRGTLFLLALVLCASMMPVRELPAPSWLTTLGIGFVSAVFDNIPLTALALEQGGYDWALLAYAAGFGGSMIWFGSSAGVAVSNICPEAKSVWLWLRHGWHVALGYVAGFFAMVAMRGWNPY